MCSILEIILIASLFSMKTNALKGCETITIDINGVEERRIDETITNNCSFFKDLSNKCKSVSIEIVLDKYVSKFYHTNYGIHFDTIQTNITFYNDSMSTSASTAVKDDEGDSKAPIIVGGVLGAVLLSGAIIYLARYIIKTIIQSDTYRFPDPS